MIWQFIWNKIELFGMLFLFLLIFSKAWQLALGKKISMGFQKLIELMVSFFKFLSPLLVALLQGLWTFLKWLLWLIIEFFTLLFRGLYELFQLLREKRSS
jgi:hypothetical protein